MRLAAINLLLLSSLAACAATAKSTDRQQPMDVEADQSNAILEDNADSTLIGNVRIVQGTLDVRADHALIKRRNGDIQEVVLTGEPATLKQVGDNGEQLTARAARIVYTLNSEMMVLTGGVVITQPRGTLRGETVKYNMDTGRLDGGGDGQRVSMRILPKDEAKPAPAPAAEPAADAPAETESPEPAGG